ncbi:AAA family ATPase [Metabacillus litoralis]|uniref:histidine kinase n=1 Tax=Metabacillus litoralis TaxID=152268 RepID=A0A5C6WB94_9BACI|nr:AAA family ATPase [Metabacillus litoralis]TXC93102.1 AAA family ATPase [Metabacillus litoralis]
MVTIQNVKSLEIVANLQLSTFYYGYSTIYNQKVLIKFINSHSHSYLEQANKENEILREIKITDVLQPLSVEEGGIITFYRYTPARPLRNIIEKSQSIDEFLEFSIKLTSTVGKLHKQNYIHCNLSPSTIFFDPISKHIKLTGFQYSRNLGTKEIPPYINDVNLELPYISPEQTGRMNRPLDYRSDLYSLGVIFYELLTKRTPFYANTSIEWYQSHLTKQPLHLSEINQQIPNSLAEIILKLLNKSPDERYQSVNSLKEDLLSFKQLREKGMSDLFFISNSNTTSPMFLNQLIGRQEELEQIRSINNIVEKGKSQILLIAGESGTGKTALVEEFKHELKGKPSYFIDGKFDLLVKNYPYSGILDAIKILLKKILIENNVKKRWSKLIQEELSSYLPMLINVLPELMWIIDINYDPVPGHVASSDTQSHFYYMFQKLIRIFAKKEHPLILFLDDIQWADSASLELIEYLLSNKETEYFYVICAFRQNEVKLGHQIYHLQNNLSEIRSINKLILKSLTEKDVVKWLRTINFSSEEDLSYISSYTLRITQGNPFYIRQLFHVFITGKVIDYDDSNKMWTIDKNRLISTNMPEDIITYIENRINILPKKTQNILKIAACIGNIFDLQTLSMDRDYGLTKAILHRAIESGLVIQQVSSNNQNQHDHGKEKYKFVHDQIQDTIYSSINEEEKKAIHLKIGRYLLAHNKNDNSKLLSILYHLNYSKENISDEEKSNLVKMNIQAGEFSRKSAAFQSALSYFLNAYELMGEQWELHYELTFDLFIQLGEAYYLNSQFEQSEYIFDVILNNAKTKVEKLKIYHLKITLYTHVHRVKEAVTTGIAALRLFDEKFPSKPNKLDVLTELVLVKFALLGKKPRDILTLPLITSEEKILILKTLINLNGPTYHVDQNLSSIFMLRAMRMTMKYGLTEFSPLVLNNYALILSAGFSNFNQSFEFGEQALLYSKKNKIIDVQGRVHFVFGSFVNHWKKHIKNNITYLEKSQKFCLQAGNIHLAGANSSFIVISHLINGTHLNELENITNKQKSFISDIKYKISEGYLAEVLEWINHLTGTKKHNWEFKKIIDDDSAKIMHYTIRLKMAFIFDNESFSSLVLQELSSLVTKRLTLVIAPEFYFYEALVLLRRYRNEEHLKVRIGLFIKILKSYKMLVKYAKQSPDNYKGKQLLIKAEMLVITGKKKSAMQVYDEAILSCETSSFVHVTAICYELAGRFYIDQSKQKQASFYLTEAYHYFLKWGALNKANEMLSEYNHYIKSSPLAHQVGNQSLKTQEINAVYHAAQILSGEVQINSLLEKLMTITITNTGATKGTILLKKDDELAVEVQSKQINQLKEQHFSKSIVQFVFRTGQIVQLDNASQHSIFQEDQYIKETNAKSVICLPITYNQEMKGILYLENEQVSHVFTEEQVKFLKLLSTQAAISIENANLYHDLEDKVKERTIELEHAKNELLEANEQVAFAEERRRDLLSNISHDLKAPIASVQGYMEAILDGFAKTEEKRNEYIRNSITRIKSLNILIHDLFDLTQLENGQLSFSFDYVRIDLLLKKIKKSYEYEVSKKGLKLQLQIEEVTEGDYPLIEVDYERMKQVFTNLITNAVKHTEEGGIELCLIIEKQHVLISCSDTGSGIEQDDLPYIFDRNFTVSDHRSLKGNGLGLSISKEIIKKHKGHIWAESKIGTGTTIFIKLPIVDVKEI